MSAELPRLRDRLEAIPIRRGQELYIALRDLEGLNPETLVLSPQAYFLVTLMDGSNSVVDIQAAHMRRFGDMLFREQLDGLLMTLDDYLFLDNETSRARMRQLIDEFNQQTTRSPFHAGVSYEEDPENLRLQLQSFFDPEKGGPGDPQPPKTRKTIAALMAPHIDLRAGGPSFAYAYKALVEASPVSTCVILGTGHEPLANCFALSRKNFETPLGSVAADKDFIDELQKHGKVVLCTSPAYGCAGYRQNWIQKNLPDFFYSGDFILTPNKERCAHDDALLIDDSETNCLKFREAGGYAILYPQPWNYKRDYTQRKNVQILSAFAFGDEKLKKNL